jgi:short-subunit dehydrogenase
MDLRNRDVILTGAAGGIGAALTLELVAAGARVLAVGRRQAALAALAARMLPGRVQPFVADITMPEQRAALAAAAARLAHPAVLVHAAGSGRFGLFDGHADAAAAMLEANTVARSMARRIAAATTSGRSTGVFRARLSASTSGGLKAAVVAIGSTFGSIGFPGFAAYSASKFALRGWMEAMARETADGSVRFQWIAPRATATAFNPPEVEALNRALNTPVDRPEVVAAAIRRAIERGAPRQQIGWPERLFVRLNGALPELVDRALRRALPAVRRAAGAAAAPSSTVVPETSA